MISGSVGRHGAHQAVDFLLFFDSVELPGPLQAVHFLVTSDFADFQAVHDLTYLTEEKLLVGYIRLQ